MRSAKLKNILAGAAGFVALAVASTPAAQAQEDYIAKWKEFAAETGLPKSPTATSILSPSAIEADVAATVPTSAPMKIEPVPLMMFATLSALLAG